MGDKLIKAIIKEDIHYSKNDWSRISNEGKYFVKQLLHKDPKKRMSIKDILQHDWIRKYYNRSITRKKTNVQSCSLLNMYPNFEKKDIEEKNNRNDLKENYPKTK